MNLLLDFSVIFMNNFFFQVLVCSSMFQFCNWLGILSKIIQEQNQSSSISGVKFWLSENWYILVHIGAN